MYTDGSNASKLVEELGQLLIDDLDIGARAAGAPFDVNLHSVLDGLAGRAEGLAKGLDLVYTAFDGDHQQLSPLMRLACLKEGKVPVNPDSVLEYKETALARQSKRDVLMDDLAILYRCDQLWIFTDLEPDISKLSNLAEGVLVELLFFLNRKPSAPIYFCSARGALLGDRYEKKILPYSFDQVRDALPADVRSEVVALAASGTRIDELLPRPIYFITDPLDFKYARFVLPRVYQNFSRNLRHVPVVPQLAVPVGDGGHGLLALGQLVLCWLRLASLGSLCSFVKSLDEKRTPSKIVEISRRCWLRWERTSPIEDQSWDVYGVPRAKLGSLWAITARERGEVSGR